VAIELDGLNETFFIGGNFKIVSDILRGFLTDGVVFSAFETIKFDRDGRDA
jgi:hypothetical protein